MIDIPHVFMYFMAFRNQEFRITNRIYCFAQKGRQTFKSTRKFFGNKEEPYIMDAKSIGNLGRYLNHRYVIQITFLSYVGIETPLFLRLQVPIPSHDLAFLIIIQKENEVFMLVGLHFLLKGRIKRAKSYSYFSIASRVGIKGGRQ